MAEQRFARPGSWEHCPPRGAGNSAPLGSAAEAAGAWGSALSFVDSFVELGRELSFREMEGGAPGLHSEWQEEVDPEPRFLWLQGPQTSLSHAVTTLHEAGLPWPPLTHGPGSPVPSGISLAFSQLSRTMARWSRVVPRASSIRVRCGSSGVGGLSGVPRAPLGCRRMGFCVSHGPPGKR